MGEAQRRYGQKLREKAKKYDEVVKELDFYKKRAGIDPNADPIKYHVDNDFPLTPEERTARANYIVAVKNAGRKDLPVPRPIPTEQEQVLAAYNFAKSLPDTEMGTRHFIYAGERGDFLHMTRGGNGNNTDLLLTLMRTPGNPYYLPSVVKFWDAWKKETIIESAAP